MKDTLPASAAGKPIEIWIQDEARVGQKGGHAHVWTPIGSRPLMVRDNRHDSAFLFGAICPDRAVGAAIIMPGVNAEAMNEHLGEISTQGARGAHAVLVCDGAGWHQTGGRLRVPEIMPSSVCPPWQSDNEANPARERRSHTTSRDTTWCLTSLTMRSFFESMATVQSGVDSWPRERSPLRNMW